MVGLNGRINGTRLDTSNIPYDAEKEPDEGWTSATTPWNPQPDAFDAERPRLVAEIAAAHARAAAARARNADRDTALRSALQVELAASQSRLVEMESEHEQALAALQRATEEQITRILGDARRKAAAPADAEAHDE